MRNLYNFNYKEHARRFASYLRVLDISSEIRQEANQEWSLWIHSESQMERAQKELEEFINNPNQPKYQVMSEIGSFMEQITEENQRKSAQENIINMRQRWAAGHIGHGIYVTMVLILISAVITLYSEFGANQSVFNLLQCNFRVISKGEVWRLITPIFIHLSILHILFNMYWLYYLGGMIETVKGSYFLIILVVISAIISNFGQYYFSGPLFGGMSGVNYALFGYIWMKSRFEPFEGLYLDRITIFVLVGWFFFCLTGMAGPVANIAHGGGLVVGIIFGYARTAKRQLGI